MEVHLKRSQFIKQTKSTENYIFLSKKAANLSNDVTRQKKLFKNPFFVSFLSSRFRGINRRRYYLLFNDSMEDSINPLPHDSSFPLYVSLCLNRLSTDSGDPSNSPFPMQHQDSRTWSTWAS